MKTSLFLSALGLIVFALVSSGCTSPQAGTAPQASPAVTPAAVSCVFTSCSGAGLACGSTPPASCPGGTSLTDKCRQYASCVSSNGSCPAGDLAAVR